MNKNLLWLLVILVAFVFSGCFLFPLNRSGSISVFLTDAVANIDDLERLDVQIDAVILISDEASVVVSDESTVVNILDLIGTEIMLATVDGTGVYDQLRFDVGDATATVRGKEYPVKVSSGSFKYNFKEPLDFSDEATLILDFDLSKSLKVQGQWDPDNVGNLHMTPVINMRHGELYDVEGMVTPHATPMLVALFPEGDDYDDEDVLTTFTHRENPKWENGEFRFPKVEAGDYILKLYDDYYTDDDTDFDIEDLTPVATLAVTVPADYISIDLE